MSGGIEVVGIVLALYPIVIDAWQAYKAAKTGVDVLPLITRFRTEHIIFEEFVGHLLGSSISEKEKAQLIKTSPRQRGGNEEAGGSCWQNPEVQADLKMRLGYSKMRNILAIIAHIHSLLEIMYTELSPTRPLVSHLLFAFRFSRYHSLWLF